MSRTIAQRDLRNDNARIIDAVAAGETLVVTRHGVPVAELRPIQERRPHLVSRTALVALAAHGPRIDSTRFRADLDRVANQRMP